MDTLIKEIRACEFCKQHLPLGPRPVVQLSSASKVVIIGQAPGRKVHESGIPWNDASGRKLRQWLNVDEADFYNAEKFSILPMGFCYPGKGPSGDLAPRRDCAPMWHSRFFDKLPERPLLLLIGHHAQQYYLPQRSFTTLTETVRNFDKFLPFHFPLPHPSPRNQNWLKVNPWFMEEVIPVLRSVIQTRLTEMP